MEALKFLKMCHIGIMKIGLLLLILLPLTAFSRGQLLLIGGGEESQDILEKMVSLSEGKVLIMPHASSIPEEVGSETKALLESAGARQVEVCLKLPDECLEMISETNLIFFTGGSQNRLLRAFKNTTALQLIREKHEDKLSLAGTSAGTAIMSEVMLTGDPEDPYDQGFGFVKKMILDMHFIVRNREPRLLKAMADHPGLIGVGVDESTAILVGEGESFQVIGVSAVRVFVGSQSFTLSRGQSFKL